MIQRHEPSDAGRPTPSTPPAGGRRFGIRVGVVVLAGLVVGMAAVLLPPISQRQSYHDLADKRVVLGVPYFGDVITHVLYLVVGLLGLRWVLSRRGGRRPGAFVRPVEAWNYGVFFLGFTLTAFGSTWYHLDPNDSTLFWDRLAMSVTFMGLVAVVVAERVSLCAAAYCLPLLVAAGAGCVLHWRVGGDLRLYFGLVQAGPMLAMVLMMTLFQPRYSHFAYLWLMFATYALAVAFEALDVPIYRWTGLVSGHSLKHTCVAGGIFWIVLMLHRRHPLAER